VKANPCICKVCSHNMGKSRVKGGQVRCNNCKTVFVVALVPKEKV
jgi:hypothetical protein